MQNPGQFKIPKWFVNRQKCVLSKIPPFFFALSSHGVDASFSTGTGPTVPTVTSSPTSLTPRSVEKIRHPTPLDYSPLSFAFATI